MQAQLVDEGIQDIQNYNRILQGNKNYVTKKLQRNPNYFKELAKGQKPKYLLIGCSDSRAPPNELTETDPGEIFIHRNIANLVIPTDLNLNCVIQYAVEHLKVHNVVIMGHTLCGGVKAAMQQESVGGMLDLWLNQIKLTYEKHQEVVNQIDDADGQLNCLCAINVREQVMNIWKNPIIQKSWEDGHPVMVHGWLFRVETGYIEEISIDRSVPEELSKVFKLKFQERKEEETERETETEQRKSSFSPMRSPSMSPTRQRKSTLAGFIDVQHRLEMAAKSSKDVDTVKELMND